TSGKFEIADLPADLTGDVQRYRDALIEKIAESDDDLTMKYLEGEELTQDELLRGLKEGILSRNLVPVLCGSGALNIGMSQLLDAIAGYAPSPADLGPVTATNPVTDQEVS